MSFNPSVPNAGESPGVFPVQNSNNFTRLQALITADHVFNDTAQSTDGVHKQVTFIAKSFGYTPTVGGGNAELYAEVDASGLPQLKFFNGTSTAILTPHQITGHVVLANNATSSPIYTIPINSSGTIMANFLDGTTYRYNLFFKSGVLTGQTVSISNTTSGVIPPDIFLNASTGEITLRNRSGSSQDVYYYITLEIA